MWRAGFDLALLAWSLNAIALVFGVGLGARDPLSASALDNAASTIDANGASRAALRDGFADRWLAEPGRPRALRLELDQDRVHLRARNGLERRVKRLFQ